MALRRVMRRSASKKYFRNRSGVHPKNNRPQPMRGGIRL